MLAGLAFADETLPTAMNNKNVHKEHPGHYYWADERN